MVKSLPMTFQDVISHFGSVAKAAEGLTKRGMKVSRQAVNLWRERGISQDRQKLIQLATRGKLKADTE